MSASSPEDPLVTVAEVAGMLKVNQQTVRNWIDQGALPALRIGRRVRIRRSDFDRLLQEGLTLPSAEPASGPSAQDFWDGELIEPLDPGTEHADDVAPPA